MPNVWKAEQGVDVYVVFSAKDRYRPPLWWLEGALDFVVFTFSFLFNIQ